MNKLTSWLQKIPVLKHWNYNYKWRWHDMKSWQCELYKVMYKMCLLLSLLLHFSSWRCLMNIQRVDFCYVKYGPWQRHWFAVCAVCHKAADLSFMQHSCLALHIDNVTHPWPINHKHTALKDIPKNVELCSGTPIASGGSYNGNNVSPGYLPVIFIFLYKVNYSRKDIRPCVVQAISLL